MSRKYTDAQRTADYKTVFGSPLGMKVLTDIMDKASVFRPIIHASRSERDRMEGARALALHISEFVKFDAKSFMDAWKRPEEVD